MPIDGAAEHTAPAHVHDTATRSDSSGTHHVTHHGAAGDDAELLRVCVSWVSGLETVAVSQHGLIADIADAVLAEPGARSVEEVFMHLRLRPSVTPSILLYILNTALLMCTTLCMIYTRRHASTAQVIDLPRALARFATHSARRQTARRLRAAYGMHCYAKH